MLNLINFLLQLINFLLQFINFFIFKTIFYFNIFITFLFEIIIKS
jgi:hypothetical protein